MPTMRRKINLETHDAAVPTMASQEPSTSRSATIDAYVNARSSSPRAFRASMKFSVWSVSLPRLRERGSLQWQGYGLMDEGYQSAERRNG